MKLSVECGQDSCLCCIPSISATLEYGELDGGSNGAPNSERSNDSLSPSFRLPDTLQLMTKLTTLVVIISGISVIVMVTLFLVHYSDGIQQYPNNLNPADPIILESTCTTERILMISTRIGNALLLEGDEQKLGEQYRELTENRMQYASQWDNVEYLETNEAMHPDSPQMAKWTKPFFIRSIMTNTSYDHFDWIFWMDADTAILNCSVSILDLIQNQAVTANNESNVSLVFNGDENALTNNGVFAIRNNEWGLSFVEQWVLLKESGQHALLDKVHPWRDQKVFIALLLGWTPQNGATTEALQSAFDKGRKIKVPDRNSIDSALQELGDNMRDHVAMIPKQLWNAYPDDNAPSPFIIHCPAGQKCKTKVIEIIRSQSNCAKVVEEQDTVFVMDI